MAREEKESQYKGPDTLVQELTQLYEKKIQYTEKDRDNFNKEENFRIQV
jgi:hypothetical protein